MGLNMYSFVDLSKSPFIEEMEAMKDHEFCGNQLYFSPSTLDNTVGDTSLLEARLIRLVFRLIEFDKNYSGIVELHNDVVDHFAAGKFSQPTLYTALKSLKQNVKNENDKPFLIQYSNRSKIYWINPMIVCKKSLIDKYLEFKKNPSVSATAATEVIIDDEEEPTAASA